MLKEYLKLVRSILKFMPLCLNIVGFLTKEIYMNQKQY